MSSTEALNCEMKGVWARRWLENTDNGSASFLDSPNSCSARVSDVWLIDIHSPMKSSSSAVEDVPLKLFQEREGVTKATLPSRSLIPGSGADEPPLKLGNISENWKKPDGSTGCRLFGIDLVSHSSSIYPVHTRPDPIPAATIVVDSERQSEVSKAPKDERPGHQVSPKEIQSKQNSSARSRTKVTRTFIEFTLR